MKQLVLYHLVPVPTNGLAERLFRRGLPEEVILAQDLQRFDLPPGTQDILIHAP